MLPQGVERQCFTGHVYPGDDVDPPVSATCLRRHLNADFGTLNEAPSDTNTENVAGLRVSGSDTCKVQPAAQTIKVVPVTRSFNRRTASVRRSRV
ncbi:hypothetical protein CTI12_AA070260 [Artemisia annua]|uniref:Uncharacterized protein n=1 Tax=Artemisia annua TaxID=35608 RepID=A0A2U1Q4A2_ARTAN|nr:hypothetical protein CTI12_AA391840 [Artemisia annua]PWA92805.1 hypothetical protein CTI12_AA070260 [Artemisia annua]